MLYKQIKFIDKKYLPIKQIELIYCKVEMIYKEKQKVDVNVNRYNSYSCFDLT